MPTPPVRQAPSFIAPARAGGVLACVAWAVACVALAGCKPQPKGPPTFTVSGRVTKGGEPLPLDEAMFRAAAASVRLTFYLFDDKKSLVMSNSTQTQLDGTFTIGRLPAGVYRVGVEHYNGPPNDLLRGQFGERSPIEIDVQADVPDVAIELDDYAKRRAN